MVSAAIFKHIVISLVCLAGISSFAQEDTGVFSSEFLNDSLFYQRMDSMLMMDSLYLTKEDTLVPSTFTGYDKVIFRNSKANLRKTLLASQNPPLRKNLDNWIVLAWAILIVLLVIFFKSNYALQYRLLNKAWISHISFNEFFSTQTSVFKNSKLLTWFIISQVLSMGVFIILKSGADLSPHSPLGELSISTTTVLKTGYFQLRLNDFALAGLISAGVILLLMFNQWLKTVFAFSFSQPSLSRDYAIIFRIQSYIAALCLIPVLLFVYYNGGRDTRVAAIVSLIIFIVAVYASSLLKFIFSGQFLQNQSNFILILYLCAFEILPLLVLIKSINSLLIYD